MKNIGIIFGGKSSEYKVSCKSVMLPVEVIDRKKYHLCLIGITQEGNWYLYEDEISRIADGSWIAAEKKYPILLCMTGENRICCIKNNEIIAVPVDAFLPILHGKNGEDGTIQGLFEMLQIPYVGCGVASSAICMDKSLAKQILDNAGIKQAEYILVQKSNYDLADIRNEIKNSFGYPVFVKPCNAGSSCGVSRVCSNDALEDALMEAFRNDSLVLIEREVRGRELECAVLKIGNEFIISNAGEIVAGDEFYTYDDKYINGVSRVKLEPDITAEQNTKIRTYAKDIFTILGCEHLSRVDFFVENTTGNVIFNEINTLPGMTNVSMYPMLMKKIGITPAELFKIIFDEVLGK